MSEDNLAPKRLPDEDLITYAGCWVAIADGSVAGVGDTAVAAERLGRQKHVLEKLHIVFIEPPEGKPLEKPQLLMHLMELFKQHDQPVYLVGGTVRDMLLGRECKDFDFAVPDRAIKLASKVADHLKVPAFALNRERDTGRVILREEGMTLDFAGFRGDDIQADLRARDFTVNAMALPVAAETDSALLDPCEGITDLHGRVIRRTHPKSISDDPIRAIRALRLAMYLSFIIEPSTSEAIIRAGPLLDTVSNERIRDELVSLLNGDDPEESMRMLHDHELLSYVLPEIAALQDLEQTAPHHETALDHTFSILSALCLVESAIFEEETQPGSANSSMRVVLGKYQEALQKHVSRQADGGVSGRLVLRLGAVLHDVGKSEAQTIDEDGRIRFYGHDDLGAKMTSYRLRRLHFSREVVEYVSLIVRGHMWPLHLADQGSVSRRAVYRFFRRSRETGIDIGLLSLADHLATHEGSGVGDNWEALLGVIDRLFDHYFNHYEETIQPPPLINGSYLISEFDLEPGPDVGWLLGVVAEAQAAGDINSVADGNKLITNTLASKYANG